MPQAVVEARHLIRERALRREELSEVRACAVGGPARLAQPLPKRIHLASQLHLQRALPALAITHPQLELRQLLSYLSQRWRHWPQLPVESTRGIR